MSLLPGAYSNLNSVTTSIVSITTSIYSFSSSIITLSASNDINLSLNTKLNATAFPLGSLINGTTVIVTGTAYGGTFSTSNSNITPGGTPWGYTIVLNKSG